MKERKLYSVSIKCYILNIQEYMMKKMSIDYRLKGEYLETYYKARAYLSLRIGYLEDVDPTIVEVVDLLMQAQEDEVSVKSIFGDDLTGFLKHLEAAFTSMPYYKTLYGYHFAALFLSIIFVGLSHSASSLIDLYGMTLILFVLYDGVLFALRWSIGRRIQHIDVDRTRAISRFIKIVTFIVFIVLITLQNQEKLLVSPLNVSMQVMLWVFGISFAPVLIVSVFQIYRESRNKKIAITKAHSSEIPTSFKEEAIRNIEKKFIKRSLKLEKNQLPPLSDQDVIKQLIKVKKMVYILFPPILLGYIVLIGFLISIQVNQGVSLVLISLVILLVLIISLLYSVFKYWFKDVSLFIYYLDRRNLQTFTPGAVPLEKLNKRYKVIERKQEAQEK